MRIKHTGVCENKSSGKSVLVLLLCIIVFIVLLLLYLLLLLLLVRRSAAADGGRRAATLVLLPSTCHFCGCRARGANSISREIEPVRRPGPSAGAEVASLRKWHVWCLREMEDGARRRGAPGTFLGATQRDPPRNQLESLSTAVTKLSFVYFSSFYM